MKWNTIIHSWFTVVRMTSGLFEIHIGVPSPDVPLHASSDFVGTRHAERTFFIAKSSDQYVKLNNDK